MLFFTNLVNAQITRELHGLVNCVTCFKNDLTEKFVKLKSCLTCFGFDLKNIRESKISYLLWTWFHGKFVKTSNSTCEIDFTEKFESFNCKTCCDRYSVWHLVSQICVKFSDSLFSGTNWWIWPNSISNESLRCLVCCLRFSIFKVP